MKPPSNNQPENNNAIGIYLDDMLHEATGESSGVESVASVALKDSSLLLQELFLPAIEERSPVTEKADEPKTIVVEVPDSGFKPQAAALHDDATTTAKSESEN